MTKAKGKRTRANTKKTSRRELDTSVILVSDMMDRAIKRASAIKHDSKKPRVDLLPPRATLEVGRVFGFGAEKYSDWNYLEGDGLEITRLVRAAMGHLLEYQDKVLSDRATFDDESGRATLAHAACSVLMALEIEFRKGKKKK